MNDATKRSIFRWIHIVFSIPIIGYVYSPFKELPNYAPVVRYVAIPVMVLTGLWMWKGHVFSTTYFQKVGVTRRCSELRKLSESLSLNARHFAPIANSKEKRVAEIQ